MNIFNKLLFLLTSKERKSAVFLLIMTIFMALLDTLGVASILPFIAVLTNPGLIETNVILKKMFIYSSDLGVKNHSDFLFVLGVLVFLTLIFSLVFKSLTTYLQILFIQMREHSIGKRLISVYLNQKYSWFFHKHSANFGKNILSEIQILINDGLRPLIELTSKSIVSFALISLLIVIDPKLTFIVGLSLAGSYGLIFYLFKKYIKFIGNERLKNNQLRYNIVHEAFGAIKEVKFRNLEKIYINLFSNSAQVFAKTQALMQILSQIPKFILEAIAFGGMLLIILITMNKTGNFNNALPIVSLYAFAGYRLMPALQQIYASSTQLVFISSSLDKIYEDLKNLKHFDETNYLSNEINDNIVKFNYSIELKNVNYKYPNAKQKVLKNINLSIQSKSIVGLIGKTGSGKTTLVDIILGILEPQEGTLEIDKKIINDSNSKFWRLSIGYVPQHIYLSDNTIASNIAFGIDKHEINYDAVVKSSKIANLHKFVNEKLPEKYETVVGENGVRLSGGQRQRIGIARALYSNPQILVLDEATNALDQETEKAVMDAVDNLGKEITIILIAHRLNTLKKCDKIINIENGQIKSSLKYDEIIKHQIYK